MAERVKMGIFGLGHLGKIHLDCLEKTPFEVVGFYDPDPKVKTLYHPILPSFEDPEELMKIVDAVDIVSPTTTHIDLIQMAVALGKHIFVEKPMVAGIEEAGKVIRILNNDLVFQVGHVERFNPAFLPLKGVELHPMFIEGHRIATFNPRGTDVSVVLDLMIHDLDIVCAIVDSEVASVHASGVSIVSDSPDIANARITFENGCVANLTASRISMKQMRKLRIFASDAYISIDFLDKSLSVINLKEGDAEDIPEGYEIATKKGKKYVVINQPEIVPNNAILEELKAFYYSITENRPVEVGVKDACRSLKLAYEILDQIARNNELYHK